MKENFTQFIKEKRFLSNLSRSTIKSYNLSFEWFEKLGGDLTKPVPANFVIGLREAGMNPGAVRSRSVPSIHF